MEYYQNHHFYFFLASHQLKLAIKLKKTIINPISQGKIISIFKAFHLYLFQFIFFVVTI